MFSGIFTALYSYEASSEDELSINEDEVLVALDTDDPDPDWILVRSKDIHSSEQGLVPRSYLSPFTPLRSFPVLYDYQPTDDDELPVSQDESLHLYDTQGPWSLCSRVTEDSNEALRIGWIPTDWIPKEEDEQETEQLETQQQEQPIPDPQHVSPVSSPVPRVTSVTSPMPMGSAKDVKTWSVTEIDKKKKKKKGTLLLGNGAVFFTSESDKTPVQQYALSTLTAHRVEKSKHLYLTFSTGAQVHFSVSSKDALEEIAAKIQESSTESAAAATATATATATTSPPPLQASSSPPAPASDSLQQPAASTATATATTSPSPRFLPPPLQAPPVSSNVNATSSSSASVPPAPPTTTHTLVSPPRPPQLPSRKSSHRVAVVMYDFDGEADDELNVTEGERVIVLDDTSDEWWKVKREHGTEEGVVPASYVDIESDDGVAATVNSHEDDEKEKELERTRQEEEKRRQREQQERLRKQREEDDEKAARKLQADEEEKNRQRRLLQEAERKRRQQQEKQEKKDQRTAKDAEREQQRQAAAEKQRMEDQRPKPSPHRIRTWIDRTGQFKVEAEFLGLNKDKIRLHKINGVIIEVPIQRMSTDDIAHVRATTGQSIGGAAGAPGGAPGPGDDVPLSKIANSPRKNSASSPNPKTNSDHTINKSPAARKSAPKKDIDWFEFFLNAGCDVDDCTRYASTFERDRMDESILPDTEQSTLRSLGLKEGDIIRVTKYIKEKYGSPPPPIPSKETPSTSSNQNTDQIKMDEELARRLSEQDINNNALSAAPTGGLFTSPNGTLKTNRRGRPTGRARSGSTPVSANTIANASDRLQRAVSPQQANTGNLSSSTNSPRPIINHASSNNTVTSTSAATSGFDDDAWTVKSKPATPQPPPSTSNNTLSPAQLDQQRALSAPPPPTATAPASAPPPQSHSVATSPAPAPPPTTQPAVSTAQAMNDSILSSLGVTKNNNQQNQQQQQQQQLPPQQQQQPQSMARGPLAPVPSNQGLLNPLVSTSSQLKPFVPTSTASTTMQPQVTGMLQAQPTGFAPGGPMGVSGPMASTIPMNALVSSTSIQQPPMLSYQATGFAPGGLAPPSVSSPQPQSLQPQQTAAPVFQQSSFISSMQPPQSTGSSTLSSNTNATSSSQGSQYQPENVFAQMKTGNFGNTNLSKTGLGPQSENKYDALRPQPTAGYTFVTQQPQQGMMVPQATGMQPQSQPMMGQPMYSQYTGMVPQQQPQQQFNMMQPQQQQQQPQPNMMMQGGYINMNPTGFQRQY